MRVRMVLRVLPSVMLCTLVLAGIGAPIVAQTDLDEAVRVADPGVLFSARSMGMGNAFNTLGNDFSAVVANPASLGLLQSLTLTSSVNFNAFNNAPGPYNGGARLTTTSTSYSQFGLTFPLSRDSIAPVFALGYTQTKSFNGGLKFDFFNEGQQSYAALLADDGNSVGRTLRLSYPYYDPVTGQYLGDRTTLAGNLEQSGDLLQDGQFVVISGGIGYEIVSHIFVGGSVSYVSGTFFRDWELWEEDSRDVYSASMQTVPGDSSTADFTSAYYHDVRSLTYQGWELRVGLIYKLENFISIGGSFTIPSVHKVSGSQLLSGTSVFGGVRTRQANAVETPVDYRISPPIKLTLGAAVNLWFVRATVEGTYIDYSQTTFDGLPLEDQGLSNKSIREQLSPVLNLNAGAELDVPFTGLVARLGAMYRPSPYKDVGLGYDRKYLTAGIGINSGGKLAVDLGYMFGWWDEPGVRNTNLSSLQDKKLTSHNFMTTFRFIL